MLETTLKMEKNARCSDLFVAEDELPHITKLHDKGFLSSSRACTQFSFQPRNVAKVLITVSFEKRFYSCCKIINLQAFWITKTCGAVIPRISKTLSKLAHINII